MHNIYTHFCQNYCFFSLHVRTAHSKLMYRREVTLQDAVVAVTLMECSMQSSALLGGINVLHSAFPASAEDEYALQGSRKFWLL